MMKEIKAKRTAGFTLIELVMVIVILGILAAFALPRFADLGGDARKASIQGAAGAMKSASGIVHSKALAEGKDAESGETIVLEGKTINLVYGYATAENASAAGSAGGILDAAQISTGAEGDFAVNTDSAGTGAGAQIIVQAKQAPTTGTGSCQVSYTAPADEDSRPTITVTVDNC